MVNVGFYWRMFTKPKEELPLAVQNATFGKGVKIYFVIGAAIGLLLAVILSLVAGLVAAFSPQVAQLAGVAGIAIFLVAPIVMGLFVVALSLLSMGISFVIAKIFGGTGSFGQMYCLFAVVAVPMLVINLLVSLIPFVGSLLSLLLGLYYLYLGVLIYEVVFGFSTLKAVLLYVVLPFLVGILLAFLVIGSVFSVATPMLGR